MIGIQSSDNLSPPQTEEQKSSPDLSPEAGKTTKADDLDISNNITAIGARPMTLAMHGMGSTHSHASPGAFHRRPEYLNFQTAATVEGEWKAGAISDLRTALSACVCWY
jgi:hypothetical protein